MVTAGQLLAGRGVGRDAAAVVLDPDAAVGQQGDHDPVAVAGQRLVDGVVDDLPDQVVQAALTGRADVHAGALADRLEALEHLDRGGVVLDAVGRLRERRCCGDGLGIWTASGVSSLTRTSSSGSGRPRRGVRGRALTWIRPRADERAASTSMIAVLRAAFHVSIPGTGVSVRRKSAPGGAGRRSRSAERGVGQVPIRPSGAQIGISGRSAGLPSALSRRCRGVRGRRGPSGTRASRTARAGPSTSITTTVPWPRSSLSRRTTVGASSCSWVAQAVESVRTTSLPSANDSGAAVRADLRPDQLGPAREHEAHPQVDLPAVVVDQPGQRGVEGLRVAVVGVGARDPAGARRAVGAPAYGRLAARASTGRSPGPGCGPGRARRAGAARSGLLAGSPGRQASRVTSPSRHHEAGAGQLLRARRRRRPR